MITADNVSVEFRKGGFSKRLKALDGFSLVVREGDIFALLGPNGAGKSTAMYCFLGLIQPDGGVVTVCGERPAPGAAMFREVAYLPEEPHYHLYLTVQEAVAYYAALYGGVAPRGRVDEAIERVGLTEHRDLRLAKCSKGMKQKVGIAQCLITTPRLVFLDEPTRGLDPVTVRDFREIILDLNRQGATIVINSHVLAEVETVCNRVAIMERGRVVRLDDMNNLRYLDRETYHVEFSEVPGLPGYLTLLTGNGGTVKGEIPADRLGEFIRFAEEAGAKIYECSLKRVTLEDAFFAALDKGE
jgi:ABC-2 type transport system ATP-binding protein